MSGWREGGKTPTSIFDIFAHAMSTFCHLAESGTITSEKNGHGRLLDGFTVSKICQILSDCLMQRMSYPTETVLSNKNTWNRVIQSFKDTPRKPLVVRPFHSKPVKVNKPLPAKHGHQYHLKHIRGVVPEWVGCSRASTRDAAPSSSALPRPPPRRP